MAIKVSGTTVIDDSRNIQNVGIITATTINATTITGDGSGLTGAGSTVGDNTSTNATFYPVLTQTTSGIITASSVSTTKLSFNPSTGTLSATALVGDGSGITNAGSTLSAGSGSQRVVLTSQTSGTMTASATDAELTYDSDTNTLSATTFSGALSGNSSTATTLESARTIGGVSFDGSANIDLPGVNTSGNQDTSGNAATATTLETARTINGISFNGSANIVTNPSTGAYSNGYGARTVQSGGSASGGSSGDIYYIY